ncbi:MAG TPA: APC family permease [Planctomycetota bacterium]|nr:APC family permease [Planctomycetota bacterium]
MERGLERAIGLTTAVGFGLGAMVGTGVFVYTGVGARIAGPAVLLSLLLAGVAAACNGLSSAQLARAHPVSGGTYAFAGARLDAWAGFAAGWLFLAAKTTSAAATALGFGAYVGGAVGLPATAVAAALTVVVTVLGFFGIASAGRVNLALLAVTLAALGAFVVTGLPRADPANFRPFAPAGAIAVLQAAALLFVAYAGYGRIATLGEEVADPRRTIPRAVVAALAAAVALYLLVTATAVGAIGAEAFGAAGADPLRAAAATSWVRAALGVGAATALGSVFLNLHLGLSRMAFAMARGGDLPRGLASVNRHSSPWAAVLLVGLAIGALLAVQSILHLVSISAFTVLVYYGLTNLSALRLRPEERLVPRAVALAGLVFCVALAASVPWRPMAVGAALLAAGLLGRFLARAFRTK